MRNLFTMYADYALAAIIGAIFCTEVLLGADEAGKRGASVAVALLFSATLLLRRSVPLLPLLAALVVIELNHTALKGIAETGAFLFGFVIAIYSAGRYARGRTGIVAAVVVVAAVPLAAFDPRQPPGFSDFAYFTMFFAGP